VSSLVKNGYFGEGAEAPAVADAKVKSVTISGLHLCCGKCVTAADTAIKSVSGVSKHNAEKGSTSVTVEGDFSTQALNNALHKAGFHGSFQ
jgi:copper chaperone CopZ